jgi:chromosomal replication initiator protein
MTYSTPDYTGRALDKAFPRYEERWLKPQKPAPAPKPKVIKRDWLLVASNPMTKHRIMIAEVQAAVCEHFGICHDELISESRVAPLVRARHTSIWMCRELTRRSISYIARQHGDRDHTTAMNAIKRISRLIREDHKFADQIKDLCNQLEVAKYGVV